MKKFGIAVVLILGLGLLGYLFKGEIWAWLFQPTRDRSVQQGAQANPEAEAETIQIIVENMSIPWEIVFLNDNSLLVTERTGSLVRLHPDTREAIEIAGVEHVGEGGLLGMALHPNYPQQNWLYLYLTTQTDQGLSNRVERYRYDQAANQLSDREVLVDQIPGAQYHDGGRIAFGPDDLLYITTGDAGSSELAQDRESLAGKILRLNPDGSIPADNPFNSPIFSYGHRNPQGLAWDDQGRLWATEHGPSGVGAGYDEVNSIVAGQNYGWPTIQGTESQEGLHQPIIQSGTDVWAPAAAEIVDGRLLFAGLRGQALYSATIEGSTLTNLTAHFRQDFGRLRVVKQAPNGRLYLATSNRDGRGSVSQGDDKVISIDLSLIGVK